MISRNTRRLPLSLALDYTPWGPRQASRMTRQALLSWLPLVAHLSSYLDAEYREAVARLAQASARRRRRAQKANDIQRNYPTSAT